MIYVYKNDKKNREKKKQNSIIIIIIVLLFSWTGMDRLVKKVTIAIKVDFLFACFLLLYFIFFY